VRRQQLDGSFEIVAVDSGSSDGTLELLDGNVDRVLRVPPDRFNHGLTRNLAVEQARSELIVFLVQDAVPASPGWLAALLAPLRTDVGVAGTFARQVPRADASAITRHYLSRWVAASPASRLVILRHASALESIEPLARLETCAFDNVCACVRRSVWQEHPFRPTPIAEDLAWGREVLLAGHAIAYTPEAVVVHSHDRSLLYEWRRTRDLHEQLFELFGLETIPNVRALARAIASSSALHIRLEAGRPLRMPRALGLAVVWPAGQWAGARAARKRRRLASDGMAACESS
jgi:rhamnosyltransferase